MENTLFENDSLISQADLAEYSCVFSSKRDVKMFWKTIFNLVKEEGRKDEQMKIIFTVKTRICHIIPNFVRNKFVQDFICEGVEEVAKRSKGLLKPELSRRQWKEKATLQMILNCLKKSVEVYYSKPNSDPGNSNLKILFTNKIEEVADRFGDEPSLVRKRVSTSKAMTPNLKIKRSFFDSPSDLFRRSIQMSASEKRISKLLECEGKLNLKEANENADKALKSESSARSTLFGGSKPANQMIRKPVSPRKLGKSSPQRLSKSEI